MQPLTAADRAELHALAEAATPGPWYYHASPDPKWNYVETGDEDEWFPNEGTTPNRDANGKFIAAARTAVPRLLAALTAAETECATLRAAQVTTRVPCAGCGIGVRPAAGRYCAACQERLAAENARLRAGLATLRIEHAIGREEGCVGTCDCGAEEHNARIDALLAEAAS